ncbi:MAG: tetratricopeptide repeat protein [Gemmataceae bacterium]
MTRHLAVALSLLALGAPARVVAGERYALLVGVKQYDRAELTALEYTENDVTALSLYLKASGYKRVVLMTQSAGAMEARYLPTAANVRKELKGLLEDRTDDDTVVLAFCGHGVQFRGSDEPYFCPMDASLKSKATLLSLSEVYGQLGRCRARTKVLFSDACRNDPLPKGTRAALGAQITAPRGRGSKEKVPENVVALFSCTEGEVAWETEKHRHGVFFHFLIEGLKGKAANAARQVTVASLADYVQREVGDFVRTEISGGKRQRPEMVGRFSTPVVIADVTEAVRREAPRVVFETTKKGLELIKGGKFRQVVEEASRGLAADPESAFLLAMRAHAREQLNDAKNALLDANKAIKLDDNLNHPYHTRGCVYLYLQHAPAKAVPEFDEALKRYPRGSASYYSRGFARLQLRQNEQAAADFTEAIRINPGYAAAYRARAEIAVRDGDAAGAVRDLDLAIEKQPKFALAYLDRGRVRHRLLGDPAGALADYEEALKHDARLSGAYYGRGSIKIDRKDLDGAIADLTKAIEFDKKPVAALVGRGYAFLLKKDYRTSIADATAVIGLDPKHALAHNNRGAAYSGLRKYDLAIRDYTRAIELAPGVPLYWTNRAKAHRALKNVKQAEADDARAKSLADRKN